MLFFGVIKHVLSSLEKAEVIPLQYDNIDSDDICLCLLTSIDFVSVAFGRLAS